MHKKLMMACMAIAAFAAFVAVPAASAATLTENGVALGVGSSITGTAGVTKFTAGGITVECTHADMHGTLTANGGTVAGNIPAGGASFTGTATGEDCTSGLGPVKPTLISELCLDVQKGSDRGTVTGCGANPVTFRLDITGVTECNYSISSIEVEITTAPADAEVKVVPGQLIQRESNPFCPQEGELDMEFALTTTAPNLTTLTFS